MKVAVDLRPLQIGHQNRGIGSYIFNIFQNLPDLKDITFIFLRYDISDPVSDYNLIDKNILYIDIVVKKQKFSKHPLGLIKYGWSNLNSSFHKIKKYHPDVFLQFDYLLGAPRSRSCQTVIVAYDLIPLKLKQIYLPRWQHYIKFRQFKLKSRVHLALRAWFYSKKYSNGFRLLRSCDKIISISKNTTKDIIELIGVKKSKISTIPLAASFRTNDHDDVIRQELKSLIDSFNVPYLTFIGGTDKRRQVGELVHAFNLYNARQKPIKLLLCGNEFVEDSKEIDPQVKIAIKESSYNSNIHLLGKVSESEKKYILARSVAMVYPTLYEGFGLPVLEAMKESTPVITYKNSSLVEVGKDAVLYTDGVGGFSIYKSILKLLGDPNLSSSLSSAGKQIADEFDWATTSGSVWEIVFNKS